MTSGSGEQLRLVIWKNLLLRRRRPIILSLEVLWPITIFGLLVGLRILLPAHHQTACYYNARALPSAGGLPLLQGLICNIDNQCLNRTQYEDIPTYPGSKLDSLVGTVSPLFNNERLLGLARELPTSARLLDAIGNLLSHDTVKQLLVTGIPVHNLATDSDEVRAVFVEARMPLDVINSLLASRLSLPSLVYGLITKHAACDEPLIKSIIISSDPRVARELANLCPFSDDFKEGLQQVLKVEEVIRLISGTAEALDQPQMAMQVAELTDLVKLAARLNFGSGNHWSEVVRHSADVLAHLSNKANMAFLREVFRDWGRTIFPQMFMDINLIADTLAKSFWTEPSSVYNDTELQAFVISLDKVMKAVSSSKGAVSKVFTVLSGNVADIAHSLDLDADWVNIVTHWIHAEAAAVSKSHTFPYFLRLVEAATLTLSDPKRLAVLLERRHGAVLNIDRDICDPDVFGDFISHSGEASEMSKYACVLLKEVVPGVIDKLTGAVRAPYQKATETQAQDAIEGVSLLVHALFKAAPFDLRAKLDSAISAFTFQTWQDRDESGRINVVAAVLQLINDFLKQIHVDNLDYVDRVIGAASSLVTILNRHISEISIKGEVSLSSTFGVVSLQRAVNLITDNIDVILETIDNLLNRGVNPTVLSESAHFCSTERPLSRYLLEDTAGFGDLEKRFCAAVHQILPEISSSGPTKDIFAVFSGVTPSNVTDSPVSWKELADNVVELKTTLLESVKLNAEVLLSGLKPVRKFASGLRVLFAAPATETELFRLRLRPLEFLLKAVTPKSAIIPFALRLTRELTELNADPPTAFHNSASLVQWAEKNLPIFAGSLIDTLDDSEKVKALFNTGASGICEMPVAKILKLPDNRDMQARTMEAFSELCEILGTSTATTEDIVPFEVVVRRLLDESATYLSLLSSRQAYSQLFKAVTSINALASQADASKASSIDDLIAKSLSSLISAIGISPNTMALASYNCSVERALRVQKGSFRSSIWTLLKDSASIAGDSLAVFMQPSKMKKVVPLINTWISKGGFCQGNETFNRLSSLLGIFPSSLANLKNVVCVSSEEIAEEFLPCETVTPAPKLLDVVTNAVRQLSNSGGYSVQSSSFSLTSWADVVLGLGNLFRNGLLDQDLEDLSSWFYLLDKVLKPYPIIDSELKTIITAAGSWAKQTLSKKTVNSTDLSMEYRRLFEILKSATGRTALEAAMWFVASAQKGIFDFSFSSLNETFSYHCAIPSTEVTRLACHNETQAIVRHLLTRNTTIADVPEMTTEEAAKNLFALLHRIDKTAALNLMDAFEHEATKYQNRILHGLGRVIMSSLWWTPLPTKFSGLIDFASMLNQIIEALPSTNVTKFFIDDFASASANFSQLPVSDSRPLIKFLIRNLVPIWAGSHKSETILLNFWNSQDLLAKAIYPTTACAENGSIGEMLDRLESPVKMVCAIPRTGLQEAYRHLMNVVLPVIAANATKRRDICLPKLWIELASWSRVSTTQAELIFKCATDLRYSQTTKEAVHIARTTSHLSKLASKFSKLQKTLKTGMSLDALASQLPYIARFENIVKDRSLLEQFTADDRTKEIVINFRWLSHHRSPSRIKRLFCRNSKSAFILFPEEVYPKSFCNDHFVHKFIDAIDFHRLHSEMPVSQNKSLFSGTWLRPLLRPQIMAAIESIARYALPFIQLAEEPLSLDTATALLVSLKERELEELYQAFEHLEGPVNEAFGGSETDALVHALRRAMGAIAQMASTGLFDVRFKVSEVLNDPESAKKAIMDALGTSAYFVDFILGMKFDISSFLVDLHTRKLTFVNVVSDLTLLKRAFGMSPTSTVFDKYSKVLKQAVDKLGIPPNPLVTVAQQKLLKNVVDVLLEKALRKNDLGWDHLVAIFSAFTSAPDVIRDAETRFAVIKDIVGIETIKGLANLNVSSNGVRVLAHPVALKLIGKLVCGRPLRALEQEFKILQPSNKEPQLNEMDIEELPDGFCRTGYEQVMRLTGGPIIWGFLKPILRGKLLYAPDTEEAKLIVSEVNKTFQSIETFRDRLYEWGDASNGLKMILGRKDAITNVKDALFSSVLEPIMKKILPDGMTAEAFDFRRVEEEVGDAGGLVDMLQLVAKISYCFTLDRFQGVDTEAELEVLAPQMTRRKEFIAAVVFDGFQEKIKKRIQEPFGNSKLKPAGRTKRGFWEMIGFVDDNSEARLPHEISYKIRMDIDNVPLTHRLKDLFWKPGAKADFFEDMRYQRGFSQMQQIIDSAILSVLRREHRNTTTTITEEVPLLPPLFVQQFPYPCYENDTTGHLLKSVVPMACLLSWLFSVAFLIRQRVLDREQHLQEVLAVMGLKPWVDVTAWVLLSGSIFFFIVLVTTLLVSFILPNSNFWLLFIFYLAFAMSILSFCYLISNLLQSNATLAALTGTLLYMISFIPFIVTLTSESVLPLGTKLLLCISMSSAFCYGSLYITRFEQQTLGLTWKTAFSSPLAGDHMHFMYALGMLNLCTIIYSLFGWYCGYVFCSNPILRKKWYFIFQYEFFFGDQSDGGDTMYIDNKADGVTISDLVVRFDSGNTAVNGLTLNLRDGEITSLLGQNGAGKTTTIRVLTGQCRATGGRVQAYGIDSRNLRDLRRLIGYCPQYNTLFDKLTIREHFQFFARLKCSGFASEEQIEGEVSTMLHMMDLTHLQNRLSCELSGGLQRRLCVGLSFIGGSKLIILDEPTSSVDPVARRQIWDLVLKYRKRRTILLTTHHMDEADILSDQVAIIHRGNLLCEGSPITLKTRFGCGYQLAINRNSGRGSDSGLSASDVSLTSNNFSVDLIDDIREFVPSALIASDEADQMVINLPHRSEQGIVYDFAGLFEKLDTTTLLGYHGFSSYRVTSTTLEDAFLNLCSDSSVNCPTGFQISQEFESAGSDGSASPVWDSASTNSLYLTSNDRIRGSRLLLTQLQALLYKRFMHSIHNWKVLFSSVVMPCLFIALAMGITSLKPDNIKEPSLELHMNLYGRPALSVLSGQAGLPLMKELLGENIVRLDGRMNVLPQDGFCPAVDWAWKTLDWSSINTFDAFNSSQVLFALDPSKVELTDYLLATYAEFADKRYGGWSLNREHIKIWYDNTAHHALPIYQNQITNAFLRKHYNNYTIRVSNHPLHLTQEQLGRETFLSRLADLGVALVILVGLGFIPASAVIYVVQERAREEKTVQHCSGVAKPTYWVSVYLWDLIVLLICIALCTIVIQMFAIPIYVGRSNFAAFILLLFLFGFSSLPLTQIASHLFNEPSIAFMVTYCLNLFFGLSIFLVLLLCQATTFDVAHLLGLCVPQYAFIQGILVLFKNHITADIYDIFDQDVYEDPLHLLSANYWMMLAVGIVCFGINVLIDCNVFSMARFRRRNELVLPQDEDADVIMERKRVISAIGEDILSLVNLSKDYKSFGLSKPQRAVDNVSFGIGKGVCFGLVGLNGAGKTTLFKILTGHIQPTSGRAFLKEKSGTYRTLAELNNHVGYCPQSDAVDDLLTPKQQLTIYAQLKGIPSPDVDEVVLKALTIFRLQDFADRPCVALSRGTRRKVCTAMAFLGDPQLVLLDEPTTGMDPVTRRLLWNSVHKCVDSGRSVLLTSHSMEECDALCHRLGIMAHGRLRCIGYPDALKYRFSQGYTLALRIEPGSEQQVLQYVTKRFPSSRVKSLHATSLQISVSSKEASLSTLFSLLQDPRSRQAGLVDFAVQQTTLDQVFVEFASQQRGDDDDEEAFSRVATVSSFGSASYQQLSSKESGGGDDNCPNDESYIDSTHF